MATNSGVSASDQKSLVIHRVAGEVTLRDLHQRHTPVDVYRHLRHNTHPEKCGNKCLESGFLVMTETTPSVQADFDEAHKRVARACLRDPAIRVVMAEDSTLSATEARVRVTNMSLDEVRACANRDTPQPPSLFCFTRIGSPHVPGCVCAPEENKCSRLVRSESADERTYRDHIHHIVQPERDMSMIDLNKMATCQTPTPPTDWAQCTALLLAAADAMDFDSDFQDLPPADTAILEAICSTLLARIRAYLRRPADRVGFSPNDLLTAAFYAVQICRRPWTFYGLDSDNDTWRDEDDRNVCISHELASLLYTCIRGGYGLDERDSLFLTVVELIANALPSAPENVRHGVRVAEAPSDGILLVGEGMEAATVPLEDQPA